MASPQGDPLQDGDWDNVQVIPEDVAADLAHFDMPLVKTPSLPPPTPASPFMTTIVTEMIEDDSSIMDNAQDMAHLILLDAPLACDQDIEDQEFLLDPEHTPTKDEKRVMKVLKYMRFLICVAAIGGFTSGYSSGEVGLFCLYEEILVTSTDAFAFVHHSSLRCLVWSTLALDS